MNKTFKIGLSFLLIFSIFSVNLVNASTFPDVKKGSWYYQPVMDMVDMGGIEGYPNGYFKPNRNITTAEYLILALRAATGKDFPFYEDRHWASSVYEFALKNRVVDEVNFPKSSLDTHITREKMAIILSNTSVFLLNEERASDQTVKNVITKITDIHPNSAKYITDIHTKGIVEGKPSGFDPKSSTTRAEACATVIRLVNKNKRISLDNVKKNLNNNNTNKRTTGTSTNKPIKRRRYSY